MICLESLKDAVQKVLDKCKKYQGFMQQIQTQKNKIDQGCTFLAYGIDYFFMRDAATDGMIKLNKYQ